MVVVGMGSLWVYCRMGSLWWRWLWFRSNLGSMGIWVGFGWFGSDLVAFWVAEFWWKVVWVY